MITISDYTNPFDAVLEFETVIAKYTGAPYCITTDCCTHAIEIAFRIAHNRSPVEFPCRTYLSVLMTMHKLDIPYTLVDDNWRKFYHFKNSNIYDCARQFEPNMYKRGTIQCISFGMTKPLQIGRGGAILTDDLEFYQRASRMRMDGRDIFTYSPWALQPEFDIGYHYYMRPEECVQGLNLINNNLFTEQLDKFYNYPDCRNLNINIPKTI